MVPLEGMEIRRALPADAEALTELTGQLGYPSPLAAVVARLETLRSLEDHVLFVATWRHRVCGWIHVCVVHRLESDDCAEIGGLLVDRAHRGRRVGKSLVHAAENWARSRGLGTLRVRSNVIREEAHRFYRQLGYASLKQSTLFVRSLEPPP